ALEIDSRVHFLGAVEHDQLPDVYGRADLFVLPSMAEAMPHVVAEAMASGLPVVATRVGGIPELLRVPEGGEFVPPGNAAALARAIGRLTADPDSLMRMGAFNRDDAVTRLSWRSAAEKYAALYARCRIGRAR
ncbi:MAG: glycosyltransferase family 4 protein, partial [Alphaproteobacteria bacterium]|nr:glycosyltransferase family 4 protein [Alphaproteobacteria bacterium]